MKSSENWMVVIDASPSGVSGDKYLGALLDLGGKAASLRKVATTVAENFPGADSVDVKVRRVERGDIGAQLVTVESHGKSGKRKASEILRSAQKCLNKLQMSYWGTKFSLSTLQTLIQAESKIHGHSPKDLELDELGSPDTLVDVLGVAQLADSLELNDATWWSTPIAVGGGTTRFANKIYPNPPPAVAEILRQNKFPLDRGPVNVELSTPTGVAITVNLVSKYSLQYPSYIPEKIGYGAGSKDLEELSNVLRLTVGQSIQTSRLHDEMVILETNLDDVSGEVIGRATEQLMDAGARDVTVTPVIMKKNRPGHIISVITTRKDAEKLANVLIAETGTLGVRELHVLRHISPRKTTEIKVKVKGNNERIKVKLAEDGKGRIVGAKPEYEDLKRVSEKTGLSVLEIQKIARPILESLKR